MKTSKLIIAILLACSAAMFASVTVAAGAGGDAATAAFIKKQFQARLGEDSQIDSVIKTPYGGLYEVRVGPDIFYTDAKAKYVFVGRVMNAETQEDYTKARVDQVTRIKFSELPLDSAVKVVKGNGKRIIAVFEDPNCGYCKRFRKTLEGMDNVTVYTFLYNILSEDSSVKSKNIWCSADRAKAWDDWMLNGKAAPAAPDTCLTTPNEKIFELGRKLRISGTPTIFFADGSRIPGAVDGKALEEKFATVKQ
jgi:thiol:disulfide interchange protein DsbC